jgi:hypothetical protein
MKRTALSRASLFAIAAVLFESHAPRFGASENVRFNQPSSSSVALNRVTGGLGPS